ncbi:hypothetical protein FGO68_gene17165 [Halteria grandinella]|uniref:Uncharacterized protein n=1 Tax=Halteria grandinella TaxID=5974 RepID=A0A8J8NWR8_HALGN|nr:hypothetical protein FGO68_gene17165 [Halteria grandinella]
MASSQTANALTAKQTTAVSPMKQQTTNQLRQSTVNPATASLLQPDFDGLMKEQDRMLNVYAQQFGRELVNEVRDSLSFKIEETGLECPELEGNPIYKNLRNRLRLFFFKREDVRRRNGGTLTNVVSRDQSQLVTKPTVDFSFKLELHKSLKRLMREVVVCKDKQIQLKYLGKVYAWYFRKLESVGMLSGTEKSEQEMLLNPAKIEQIEQMKREKQELVRQELLDEEKNMEIEKTRFDRGQRSVHRDIAPAKDRVQDYKRKCFGRLFNGLQQARGDKTEERPASSATSLAFADLTTQAQSEFEEQERSTYSLPFNRFFTNNDQQVVFKNQNRFEGRSNYYHYYPTDDMKEQDIEKMWFLSQNKQVADKRREEEMKATLKEWSQARGRVEGEVKRKQEHQNSATKFAESRGYQRSNMKTKGYNHEINPLLESSSSDDDEAHEIQRITKKGAKRLSDQDEGGPVVVVTQSVLSPTQRRTTDVQDPYVLEDAAGRSKLAMQQLEAKSREIQKSAKTVMKRPQISAQKLYDLTTDPVSLGIRPSTAIQIKQIENTLNFNRSLPPNKQSQALPTISASNIGSITRVHNDPKKGPQFLSKFNAIGLIDDASNNSRESHFCKVSQQAQVRTVSTQSARKKIELIRKHQSSIIGTSTNGGANFDENNLDNVFTTSAKGSEVYSLSMFSRAQTFLDKAESAKMNQHWLRSIDNLNLSAVPEETAPPSPQKVPLPEFKVPAGLYPVSRDGGQIYKMEQMREVESIKSRLDRDNCPQSAIVIQRAIVMPDKLEFIPDGRKYPTPEQLLMVNPNPKKKATKGKKKKGKK